ncbi:MAG: HAMP domain-containing protein, partial [Treponema sp.]|nr:HAMP domain-containing protein [Treponema sp.]
MTIRRQLFFSNVRVLILSFATLVFVGNISAFIIFRTRRPYSESLRQFIEPYRNDMRLIWILGIAFFIILMSIINNYYTHRMSRRIIKPLEPLSEGVHQINDNNFSYRIIYNNDDEFRPICDAFNEMASKLEASAIHHQKEEANRRELIAGISHDLRTPLTSIKGCLEGIETGVASTPEMKERYLQYMKRKTADLEHIIEQLFLFSKLDMDEFPLSPRHTDLGLAVSDMMEDSRSEYALRGLDIKFSEMSKNAFVNADV